jgi:hypothetical protein
VWVKFWRPVEEFDVPSPQAMLKLTEATFSSVEVLVRVATQVLASKPGVNVATGGAFASFGVTLLVVVAVRKMLSVTVSFTVCGDAPPYVLVAVTPEASFVPSLVKSQAYAQGASSSRGHRRP